MSPSSVDRFCALPNRSPDPPPSPSPNQSRPSGPKRMVPPLWFAAGCSRARSWRRDARSMSRRSGAHRPLHQAAVALAVREARVEVAAVGREGDAEQAPLAVGRDLAAQVEQRRRPAVEHPDPAFLLGHVERRGAGPDGQGDRLVELGDLGEAEAGRLEVDRGGRRGGRSRAGGRGGRGGRRGGRRRRRRRPRRRRPRTPPARSGARRGPPGAPLPAPFVSFGSLAASWAR